MQIFAVAAELAGIVWTYSQRNFSANIFMLLSFHAINNPMLGALHVYMKTLNMHPNAFDLSGNA